MTQALQLYKNLGLVYEEKNGNYLAISDFESLIGSESDSAERMRRHRNGASASHSDEKVTQTVTADIDIEKDSIISGAVGNSTTKTTTKKAECAFFM